MSALAFARLRCVDGVMMLVNPNHVTAMTASHQQTTYLFVAGVPDAFEIDAP